MWLDSENNIGLYFISFSLCSAFHYCSLYKPQCSLYLSIGYNVVQRSACVRCCSASTAMLSCYRVQSSAGISLPVLVMTAVFLLMPGSSLRPQMFSLNTRKEYSFPMTRSDTVQLGRRLCSYTVNHSWCAREEEKFKEAYGWGGAL